MNQPPDSAKKHQKFEDDMKRLHGEIERYLYAAEVACPNFDLMLLGNVTIICKKPCAFMKGTCTLPEFRAAMHDQP